MDTPAILVDYATGRLSGAPVQSSVKTLSAMQAAWRDTAAAAAMNADTVIYRVQYWLPEDGGRPGDLLLGSTVIEPGRVGDEYFMTQGHFHARRDRSEFYLALSGQGGLILMDEAGHTRWEPMGAGTVHYIPGRTAHRTANTGRAPFIFLSCSPRDAGHDYETIRRTGFTARLRAVDGRPALVGA
jgi:glucose-6-phosphate isomerase